MKLNPKPWINRRNSEKRARLNKVSSFRTFHCCHTRSVSFSLYRFAQISNVAACICYLYSCFSVTIVIVGSLNKFNKSFQEEETRSGSHCQVFWMLISWDPRSRDCWNVWFLINLVWKIREMQEPAFDNLSHGQLEFKTFPTRGLPEDCVATVFEGNLDMHWYNASLCLIVGIDCVWPGILQELIARDTVLKIHARIQIRMRLECTVLINAKGNAMILAFSTFLTTRSLSPSKASMKNRFYTQIVKTSLKKIFSLKASDSSRPLFWTLKASKSC